MKIKLDVYKSYNFIMNYKKCYVVLFEKDSFVKIIAIVIGQQQGFCGKLNAKILF